jgi:hypothetical protein
MDNVQNCYGYINIRSSQNYRSCYITRSLLKNAFVEYAIMNVFNVE